MGLKIRKREKESTSGNVRNTTLARDVEGVREKGVQRTPLIWVCNRKNDFELITKLPLSTINVQ